MGEQYGFRKIRRSLDVTAFGVNAISLPPGYETGRHFHDEQEELYFVHRGTIEVEFGDGAKHVLEPGGVARVDPATVRKIRTSGSDDAIYVIVGAKDGYVGRDGRLPDGRDQPLRRRRASGRVKSHTVYRTFETAERREFVRITEDVQAAVDEAGIAEGMVARLRDAHHRRGLGQRRRAGPPGRHARVARQAGAAQLEGARQRGRSRAAPRTPATTATTPAARTTATPTSRTSWSTTR